MAETRKSWLVTPKAGSFDRLKLVDQPIAAPEAGEVVVEVKAFGLNFADLFAIVGLYSATPKGEFIPGLEFAGVITQVGQGVTDLQVGQRVMGVTRFGGYTTHITSNQNYLIPLQDDWTFEEGAAYLVQVFTAYYGLVELGNLQRGDTVLIHSAAGGVGLWSQAICKYFDCYTLGSVGNSSKLELLKEVGYDKGIVRSKNFYEDLKSELGDRELNIVMECIGGKILMDSYKNLAVEGRLIVYGSAHFASPGKSPNKLKLIAKYLKRPKLDPLLMLDSNKGVFGFNLIYLFNKSDRIRGYLTELDKMDLGKPRVGHSFQFDNLKSALELFLSGSTTGKVVITV